MRSLSALRAPREGDPFRGEIRARNVTRVQPHGLSVVRVATPPGWMMVGASRQLLTDGASHFSKAHLDARMVVGAKVRSSTAAANC